MVLPHYVFCRTSNIVFVWYLNDESWGADKITSAPAIVSKWSTVHLRDTLTRLSGSGAELISPMGYETWAEILCGKVGDTSCPRHRISGQVSDTKSVKCAVNSVHYKKRASTLFDQTWAQISAQYVIASAITRSRDLGSSCEDVSPGSGLILVCCRATHSLGQEKIKKRKKLQASSRKLQAWQWVPDMIGYSLALVWWFPGAINLWNHCRSLEDTSGTSANNERKYEKNNSKRWTSRSPIWGCRL